MLYHSRQRRELEDDHIDIDLLTATSTKPLVGIATSTGDLRRRGSDTLLYYDFAYRGTAQSLRLHLTVSRFARIEDRVIQLYYGGSLQGPNLARIPAQDREVYEFSGPFTIDSDFGVAIDLQPHRSYPSSNTLYIRSVTMEFLQ
jgi:hypothetical protein